LVILYSDDYMFGDLNIIRFILLVFMFVVYTIYLIKEAKGTDRRSQWPRGL